MPELPEVDSYRTGLAKIMKGWKISGGNVIWSRASDANFEDIKNQKINKVDYIISALPLSLIPIDIKNSIIQNSIEYLKIDGQYVQFQYTPYDYQRLKRYFNKVKLSLTFTNFPPAFLYRCYP